jgi:glutathione S-transferase
VLEAHLKKQDQGQDGPWLVGGKYSYADLAFVPWQQIVTAILKESVDLSEFTEVQGWMERMMRRQAVGEIMKTVLMNQS